MKSLGFLIKKVGAKNEHFNSTTLSDKQALEVNENNRNYKKTFKLSNMQNQGNIIS